MSKHQGYFKANDYQPGRILTVHQFGKDFGMSYPTAMRWLKSKNIKLHRMGMHTWVCHEDLWDYFSMEGLDGKTDNNADNLAG